jgi:hypothetical protein
VRYGETQNDLKKGLKCKKMQKNAKYSERIGNNEAQNAALIHTTMIIT